MFEFEHDVNENWNIEQSSYGIDHYQNHGHCIVKVAVCWLLTNGLVGLIQTYGDALGQQGQLSDYQNSQHDYLVSVVHIHLCGVILLEEVGSDLDELKEEHNECSHDKVKGDFKKEKQL